MIWLSRICFSLLAAGSTTAGTIAGVVTIEAVKDKRAKPRQDASGVVVWLEPATRRDSLLEPKSARMLQKGKTFAPHVLAVPVGSSVEFPNLDPIFHNAFSNFSGQIFDVGLYPPGASRTVKFRREGIVRVFCNIHPSMSAVIAVLDTPWYAVSRKDGSFEIDGLLSGEYTLRVFYDRATPGTLQALERKIRLSSNLRLPLTISEAGYIQMPHKNKYGKDYPPVTVDITPYPGVRK